MARSIRRWLTEFIFSVSVGSINAKRRTLKILMDNCCYCRIKINCPPVGPEPVGEVTDLHGPDFSGKAMSDTQNLQSRPGPKQRKKFRPGPERRIEILVQDRPGQKEKSKFWPKSGLARSKIQNFGLGPARPTFFRFRSGQLMGF